MQAHNADYLTQTEVGVINNYKEIQNVNTGDNYGMFNLAISCSRLSAVFQ